MTLMMMKNKPPSYPPPWKSSNTYQMSMWSVLYNEIFKEGRKLRVIESREDGTYILHSYDETKYFFGIFSHKNDKRYFALNPITKTIMSLALHDY